MKFYNFVSGISSLISFSHIYIKYHYLITISLILTSHKETYESSDERAYLSNLIVIHYIILP